MLLDHNHSFICFCNWARFIEAGYFAVGEKQV